MSWIQTHSGLAFDLAHPSPEMVRIEDIAHALAHLCRFTGHARVFYSVAQHSILVSERCADEDALWGLLHDGSEAYIGDLAKPLKGLGEMTGYRELERRVGAAVSAHFGLASAMPESVRKADLGMLATEAQQLLGTPPRSWELGVEPYPDLGIEPLPPARAKQAFLERYAGLRGAPPPPPR